jgi:hypothetical protein
MMQDDFYGLNQQVRWIGFVEDNKDPSQLGRCKVRILGWYSEDKNLAPTDCLPWAQAQFAPGIKSFAVPKVGEWVTGYFLDGKMAQHPVYDGVLPGVNYNLMSTIPGAPRPPNGITLEQADTPSISRLGRGEMTNSLIDQANQTRSHVCDITPEIQQAVALARLAFSSLLKAIREAVKKFIDSLNLDPSGELSKLAEIAQWLSRKLKEISDTIQEILDIRAVLFEIAAQIRQLIDFILSLPEKALRFLRDCLTAFLGALATGVSDLISGVSGPGVGLNEDSIGTLTDSVRDIYRASETIVNQSVDLLTTPAQLASIVLTPTSVFDQNRTTNSVLGFLADNVPNTESIIANTDPFVAITIPV